MFQIPGGVVPSTPDVRDYKLKRSICASVNYPLEFSLNTVPVKNQGVRPTCVAHASSTITEYYYSEQHEDYQFFSTNWIYGIRDVGYYQGNGMALRDALNTLLHYGVPYECDCPGNYEVEKAKETVAAKRSELEPKAYPHRITKYFRLDDIKEMKRALSAHGYILASMNVREGDHLVNFMWTTDLDAKVTGAHAIVIYGWNEFGWLAQNSWGSGWGNKGRFIIPYDFQLNEVWGTEDTLVEAEDDLERPYNTKIGRFFAKIFNLILNCLSSIKR